LFRVYVSFFFFSLSHYYYYCYCYYYYSIVILSFLRHATLKARENLKINLLDGMWKKKVHKHRWKGNIHYRCLPLRVHLLPNQSSHYKNVNLLSFIFWLFFEHYKTPSVVIPCMKQITLHNAVFTIYCLQWVSLSNRSVITGMLCVFS